MATKAAGKKSRSASRTRSAAKSNSTAQKPIRRELGAVICFFLGLFTFIGYFNVDALFIEYICTFIKGLIGYGYYILPPILFVCAFILCFHHGRPVRLRTICALAIPFVFGAILHLIISSGVGAGEDTFALTMRTLYTTGKAVKSGGLLSGLAGFGLKELVSVYGAIPVMLFILLALVLVVFKLSPVKMAENIKNRPRPEYPVEPEPQPAPARSVQTAPAAQSRRRAIDIAMDDEPAQEYEEEKEGFFNRRPRVKTPATVYETAEHKSVQPEEAKKGRWHKTEEPVEPALRTGDTDITKPAVESPTTGVEPVSAEEAAKIAGVALADVHSQEIKSAGDETGSARKPMDKNELQEQIEEVTQAIEESEKTEKHEYCYPPVSLLHKAGSTGVDGREEIAINRERLQSTLNSFGVNATITDVTRGPTVTRYDLELEAGVKLNKLTNLAGDLALSLGVTSVRIAPIPDKISTVGVEVPNKIVSTVYLGDIIDSDAFRHAGSKLTFAIGEDIGGNCICGNISKLPHMLIAGTTGSGKSVCMNSLILSLLYKANPDEVKLIMIDPKMVELGIYNGIPHLYIPVVTDPKKAAGALQWAVIEMLKRYRLFSEIGVRDLAAYNSYQKNSGEETLPQVVIVIDELADLMLVASKEVEESICRVAQMGRAAGMHLVIATQRPSADVITGLMKANIPSRIAFAVSSALESRIILDTQGAEKLVGMGDMLYAPIGIGKPTRIQGAFVSDEEREEVVNFVKSNGSAEYNKDILDVIESTVAADKAADSKSDGGNDAKSEYDELLPQAVEVIFETKQASVSMLQRRLKLGYSRAARIIDQMEEVGVVGPFEGSKPRQIMMSYEQWQEVKMQMFGGTGAAGHSDAQMSISELAMENQNEAEDGL